MRYLLSLGIAVCAVQYLLAEGSTFSSSDARQPEVENETAVDSSNRAKRFDPYPYDDGRDDLMDKRFDPYQKRFDPYQKRFDPYSKRFDPYQKRFDPWQKRFDSYEKRFDPYQKRLDSFGPSVRRRRVDFAPIDARAFFVALG